MKWFIKVIAFILGLFGLSTILSASKSKEVKELRKVIKEVEKKKKNVAKKIEKLEDDKKTNKKEITDLKKKLTRTKNDIKKMEDVFEKDDVDDAVKFLRKFSKSK